ncbi:hypothetical protein NDU88_000850 [Pleurodeles waltl]|uniref:Uncharacterized protein n=1 Tax=Pleurodeles waltl TaxID=8319 RepID=A0AAV7VUQ2_PLEWA|nr:hypothetical protein NDU88_000850 [Pleurodeles waltl]
MEERLVEALGTHVPDSVNQALIKALRPFTHPLMRYGHREFRGRFPIANMSRDDLTSDAGFAQRASVGPTSLAEIFAQMAVSVLKDHEYDSFTSVEASGSIPRFSPDTLYASQSASSHSSDSDQADHPKPSGKCKRKSRIFEKDNKTQRTLSFDPEAIIHPLSTQWIPCSEVLRYVQDRVIKGFYCDTRSTLRSECPRPSLLGKVADTPELDLNLETFIKMFTKDTKKPEKDDKTSYWTFQVPQQRSSNWQCKQRNPVRPWIRTRSCNGLKEPYACLAMPIVQFLWKGDGHSS